MTTKELLLDESLRHLNKLTSEILRDVSIKGKNSKFRDNVIEIHNCSLGAICYFKDLIDPLELPDSM